MTSRVLRLYCRVLAHHPLPVVAVVLVVVVSCTLLNILVATPPDFSDPMQGFVPRHTDIHTSYSAWNNLLDNTAIGSESNKVLTTYPKERRTTPVHIVDEQMFPTYGTTTTGTVDNASLSENRPQLLDTQSSAFRGKRNDFSYQREKSQQVRLRRSAAQTSHTMMSSTATIKYSRRSTTDFVSQSLSRKEQFFCDSRPRRGYSQLVFATDVPLAKLDLLTFRKLCELQTLTESSANYEPSCEVNCLCRSFSLVNYITYLSGETSCEYIIQESDIQTSVEVLVRCRPFYERLPLDCWLDMDDDLANFKSSRCNVTLACADVALYEMFHYIISKGSGSLLTISFIHMSQGLASYDLYLDLLDIIRVSKANSTRLMALDFGLKEHVFESSLLSDTGWVGLALLLVIIIIWIFSGSIFITCMTFSSVIFTIILSFTFYQFVIRIQYFPFLNLLAAVVIVGIGADDLFIYWKTWLTVKHGRDSSTPQHIISLTFRHASMAMFVTSASTASAFYASTYTDLVSVRCFCVYAGTCVLIHYLVVISWLAACVVLYEKYALRVCHISKGDNKLAKVLAWLTHCSATLTRALQERQSDISVLSHIWLPVFFIISFGAAISLFVWPRFSPPSSDMFQMLASDHPFEIFDRDARTQFQFTSHHDKLPLIFVFGVDHTFTGEYFDLSSSGLLVIRPISNISSPDIQLWFSDFCAELRQQTFFDDSVAQPTGCFVEELRIWLRFRSCSSDPVCCESLVFPYPQPVFLHCLQTWSSYVREHKLNAADPGVRYLNQTPAVVIIGFRSNVKFDYNFSAMNEFYVGVSEFIKERISLYPDMEPSGGDEERALPLFFFTTTGGWLFYDVQSTLLASLPIALLVVLTAAATIILLTTLNLLLTVCALISISCSILTTLGALALMRWELNILESVIISLTIGLSMDFPLHVVVAYRVLTQTRDRKHRVIQSLRHVSGCLTAAMATTLVAGLCMLPAQVLAYTNLGIFLALVTSISWLYSTLFMPSLLLHIGPVGSFLQLDLGQCCEAEHEVGSESRRSPVDGRWESLTLLTIDISETGGLETSTGSVDEPVVGVGSASVVIAPSLSSDAVWEGGSLMTSEGHRRLSPIPELNDGLSDTADSP